MSGKDESDNSEEPYDDLENYVNVEKDPKKEPSLSGYDMAKPEKQLSIRATIPLPECPKGSSPQNSKRLKKKTIKIVLILVAVLVLIALVLAAFAVHKYRTSESTTEDTTGNVEVTACKEEPCKNQGKCVNIVQGGYYCICDSGKYYGRHCENEILDARPVLYPYSCQNIKNNDGKAKSGIYLIQLRGANRTFPVYCDQETEGGGWTLVWSYGFTNYENFNDTSNAVTPIPTWASSFTTNVVTSTIPPLSEDERGAIEFVLWKDIGSEFMVKSNINNWIKCAPEGGSLTMLKSGGLSCKLIKMVQNCTTVEPNPVPVHIEIQSLFKGPGLLTSPSIALFGQTTYYYWDGYTIVSGWPRHDPCGKSEINQKMNVANPGGAILLR